MTSLEKLLVEIGFDEIVIAQKGKWVIDQSIYDTITKTALEADTEYPEYREQEIRSTVEEMRNNANTYSCALDKNADLTTTFYIGKKGVIVVVADTGIGIKDRKNFDKVLEKVKMNPARHTKYQLLYDLGDDHESGAGLHFLVKFSNFFEYNEQGNQLTIQFNYTA